MKNNRLNDDLNLAKRICEELKAGHSKALSILVEKFDKSFCMIIQRKLFLSEQNLAQEILHDFWEKKLMVEKAICKYTGKNNSSLKNFLTSILIKMIYDIIRHKKTKKQSTKEVSLENAYSLSLLTETTPQQQMIQLQKHKIFYEALSMLQNISPKDAQLIEMHLDNKTFLEMARIKYKDDEAGEISLDKKAARLRKQFTRPRTGSKARFKAILEKLLKQYKIDCIDFAI